MSRWHEECFGNCEECITATTICTHRNHCCHEDTFKRFMTIGPVRYGMRMGAVSPPPPGAGPRYRSQSCWPSSPCSDSGGCENVSFSQIPLLNSSPINSFDIISCANAIRMNENAMSDKLLVSQQTSTAIVRDHVLYSGKCLLKTQLKRCALVRPQVYSRLAEYGDIKEAYTLDRLPRFRFGGNRMSSGDKRNEQRHRELTDRLKRGTVPIPPPRTRHLKFTPPASSASSQESDYDDRSALFQNTSISHSENSLFVKKPVVQHEDASTNISSSPKTKTLDQSSVKKLEEERTNLFIDIPVVEVTSESTDGSPHKSTNETITLNQGKKRDKSKRRKGIYLPQWPDSCHTSEDVIPQFVEDGDFPKLQDNQHNFPIWNIGQEEEEETASLEDSTVPSDWSNFSSLQNPDGKDPPRKSSKNTNRIMKSDSLSEGEPDLSERKSDQCSLVPSDVSDCESRVSNTVESTSPNIPRRYSKRPLRGPYGQMLEAEMRKPEILKNLDNDLKFMEDLSTKKAHEGFCKTIDDIETDVTNQQQAFKHIHKRKVSVDNLLATNDDDKKLVVSHQRTTSSPSKLEGFANSDEGGGLFEDLLRGSSERLGNADMNQQQNDTRTHVVVELFDNERSYVESLQILYTKYLEPLKAPENANLLDSNLVDEIFYQIPFLLSYHQAFLEELKNRLEHWDVKQKIGDVFLDMFSKSIVIENYTNYVNNWKKAREILKNAQQSKPAFSKFLESTARQHSGKLALDSLLIKPIQKFPKYELLLQRLIKHTDESHPDHNLLLAAQKQVHEQLLKINCTEKETLELEQLREIEGLIDGLIELATPERQYLRHDSVSMSHGGGPQKERALFLFSDLLLITGIKRRSGTTRRPVTSQGSVASTFEANKYKLLMKVPLEDIEIIKSRDDNVRQILIEVDNLNEDLAVLSQINEMIWSLHCNHSQLEEVVKEMVTSLSKQLTEQQNSDSQLSCLDLTVSMPNGPENVSIIFSKPEKRTSWEESLIEAKQKLAMSGDRRPCPELLATVPIRKTRAGLQFTCAAPAFGQNGKDVWVCNSDGYVGQVCVLSFTPEPTVTSCNGVCNARILCIASVPGINSGVNSPSKCHKNNLQSSEHKNIHFDTSSSSDEDENDGEFNEEQTLAGSENCSSHEEAENQQSTMWLGTEDGCIHVYNSSDNIRIKKNKMKLQLGSSILCIVYLDNKVFVSLANGDINIYERESSSNWNMACPTVCTVGSLSTPVSKMLPTMGKLWCSCGNSIKIFNTQTYTTENNFNVNNDNNKSITCIVLCGNGVWLTLQNSAIIKCYHAIRFDLLCELNVAPAVTKMLNSCDDIIRQHKAACLRVTALVTCKDLLWVGTSAGVLLIMPLPHISATITKLTNIPTFSGVPHGHTGHVRFLTSVEIPVQDSHRNSYKSMQEQRNNYKLVMISGGDGYEDFRTSNLSEVAGREDATNHLLMWNV